HGEFSAFFDRELVGAVDEESSLQRVNLGATEVFLARFSGSYFALRAAVEDLVGRSRPERTILYLPGVNRDLESSVLMEIEKAGRVFEPELRPIARRVMLSEGFNEAQIDEILKPDGISYDDIIRVIQQRGGFGEASLLRAIFDGAQGNEIITRWIVDDSLDG